MRSRTLTRLIPDPVFAMAAVVAFFYSNALLLGAQVDEPRCLHLIVIFPGGQNAEVEAEQMLASFVELLATQAETGPMVSAYFSDIERGLEYLRQHPDSFVIGSLGLFLDNRHQFKLAPLAEVKLPHAEQERYYLVAQKGVFRELGDLKGKELAGNTLFEPHVFLNRIVFQNQLDVASFFELKPTSRPLSALRRVSRGTLDAVLINQIQYHGLAELSLLDDLDIVYRSPGFPALGLMMSETPATLGKKDAVLKAFLELVDSEEGKAACQSFGVDGFQRISEEKLHETIVLFDQP